MPKMVNVKERVHQPFRDSLCRFSGYVQGGVTDITRLFIRTGQALGASNLVNGAVLPSDQSFVILAIRVMLWFRPPSQRGGLIVLADGGTILADNGDWQMPTAANSLQFATTLNGNAIADYRDSHRLYFQASEQLLWSVGGGNKESISDMPSMYFPYSGGLHGCLGGVTDLIHWDNGLPDNTGLLRLARAIVIPPRQNMTVTAKIEAFDDAGNGALFGSNAPNGRNMLSLRDNLNAVDLMNKCVAITLDGLHSRDVQ